MGHWVFPNDFKECSAFIFTGQGVKRILLELLPSTAGRHITQHHMWDKLNPQQDLLVSTKTLKSALT